jgi:putative hydrolase of the HAD superfamily
MPLRRSSSRAAPQGLPFERLEPYDGKLSRTVLRGERGGNASDLPGVQMRMTARAVIFDLFGTLVYPFPSDRFEQSLQQMAEAVGVDYQSFSHAWTGQTNIRRQTGAFPSFREEIMWICRQRGITPSDSGLNRAIQLRYNFTRGVLRPRQDAVPTLKQLRSMGVLRGLISDCSEEVPELWLETEFHGLFDATVFSCSAGVKKPDPAIFRLACDGLGVVARECIYIGDGFSKELSGARRIGMRPFLLMPRDEGPLSSSSWEGATWQGEKISSLSSVIDVLREEPNQGIQPTR